MAQVDTSAQHGSSDDGDDWSAVQDPNTRRKIQNRLAQRKFREKARLQREEAERAAVNQYRASGAYVAPTPDEVDTGSETGLPWGSLSFRQAVAAGTVKEQSSRETSIYAAASRTGGSSR
ncbi:hypothetical protein B0A50_04883 [Salinomyces thailandicus]|uniref:BZIP domain-containing protein n=1 Tax=Salinomyces thailandicus TaxID=706561 RepID=A0A4U0U041_9PEZI|nr:hypothetical protein B0A50_04883 [Salinomyces thailandica]